MNSPQDLLAGASASYNAAVAYLNDTVPGATFVTFEQQLVDSAAAGAMSRQAEVDAAHARITQTIAAKDALQIELDSAHIALAAANAGSSANLHQDVGGAEQ